MSDFDKEAEREKLREKYERDEAEREATQRMSDLLLKGATMTNTHCGTCGDPLFQQDGTTFCPSCHGNPDAVQGTGLEARPAEEPASGADDGDGPSEPRTEPAETERSPDEADAATSEPPTSPERAGRKAEAGPAGETSQDPSPSASHPSPERDARAQSARTDPSRAGERGRAQHDAHHAEPDRSDDSPGSRPSGDLETARDSLVAALEKFSRKAAETDDPRHAKACLEAAREASETLDALR